MGSSAAVPKHKACMFFTAIPTATLAAAENVHHERSYAYFVVAKAQERKCWGVRKWAREWERDCRSTEQHGEGPGTGKDEGRERLEPLGMCAGEEALGVSLSNPLLFFLPYQLNLLRLLLFFRPSSPPPVFVPPHRRCTGAEYNHSAA